jgi:hypothetical protein
MMVCSELFMVRLRGWCYYLLFSLFYQACAMSSELS